MQHEVDPILPGGVGTNLEATWVNYRTDGKLWFTNNANNADIDLRFDNVRLYVKTAGDPHFIHNIDDDDSFSAQVLNKISHGQKFIFQPDNTNANPDQFAICVLDQDSFSMKRTAWNVYDISMKIKEVW